MNVVFLLPKANHYIVNSISCLNYELNYIKKIQQAFLEFSDNLLSVITDLPAEKAVGLN